MRLPWIPRPRATSLHQRQNRIPSAERHSAATMSTSIMQCPVCGMTDGMAMKGEPCETCAAGSSAAPCSAWVSVLVAMPPEDTPVMCWWRTLGGCKIMSLAPRMQGEESWLTAYWCERPRAAALAHPYDAEGNPTDAHVSHWMPLPSEPNSQDR